MNNTVDARHPQQTILFFVADSVGRETRDRLTILVRVAKNARTWTISPPMVVDVYNQADSEENSTFGVMFKIYMAFPGWREKLPRVVDRTQFEECEFLVRELESFSRNFGVEFEGELDDVYIGDIYNGTRNKCLSMFLDEWRRSLKIG